jgi:hypothetical protein
MSEISGQIQGLEIALQSLSTPDLAKNNKDVIATLQEHGSTLQQCLKVCVSAAEAARGETDNTFRHMEAFDRAKHLVVTRMGQVTPSPQYRPMTVGSAISHQDANMMFVQDMGPDVAVDVVGVYFGTRKT